MVAPPLASFQTFVDCGMDVFLSYRRASKGDTMQAGRLYDYLRSALRLEVYYDRSERSNPTGMKLAETIGRGLDDCRVVLVLINRDWVERIEELRSENDWVRAELLRASSKRVVPLYLDVMPKELVGKLPPDLAFVTTISSHLLWSKFEDSEKEELKAVLKPYLPQCTSVDRYADGNRLELLCDRTHPEDCFRHAIERQDGQAIGTGWLLFGEHEQAASDMFARIRIFTLQAHINSQAIPLRLQELRPGSDAVVQAMLTRAEETQGITRPASLETLAHALGKKSVRMAVFYAVVDVRSAREAERWKACFEDMLKRMSCPPGGSGAGCSIVFALALIYRCMPMPFIAGLRRRISGTSSAIARCAMQHPRSYFETEFPRHFDGDLEPFTYPEDGLLTSRLRPVQRQHVDDWYDDPQVRGKVSGDTRNEVLRRFGRKAQRPMSEVLEDLRKLVQSSTSQA